MFKQTKTIGMVALVVCLLLGVFVVAAQGEPITLTITGRMVAGGVNTNSVSWYNTYVIPTFEEKAAAEGKNIDVQLIEFGGSDEQLKQQFALDLGVGAGADLMGFDGFWIPEFVEAGLIKPLNEVVGPEVNDWDGWDHIPAGIQSLMSFAGEVYGVPSGTDVRQIFYRKDIFEQAGIELPWQPTSWQDILDTAQTLKDFGVATPIQLNAGTAMGEATTMQGFDMALLGTGNGMYDFDQQKWIVSSPGILNTLEFYQDIYENSNLGDARMQLVEDGRQRSFEAFAAGDIAMLVEGDFFWRSAITSIIDAATRNEQVGWAMMPAMEPGMGLNGQDFVSISGGGGLILNPNTAHPQEAWELMSFIASQDSARAFQLIQPRISFRDDVSVAGDPVMTAMAEALRPLSTVRPQLPVYPQVSAEAQLMTERVVSGEMTPMEAMEAYQQAVTELVGEDNVLVIPLE